MTKFFEFIEIYFTFLKTGIDPVIDCTGYSGRRLTLNHDT